MREGHSCPVSRYGINSSPKDPVDRNPETVSYTEPFGFCHPGRLRRVSVLAQGKPLKHLEVM
jgi:hypothetical protein